jgi:hypothetical protein
MALSSTVCPDKLGSNLHHRPTTVGGCLVRGGLWVDEERERREGDGKREREVKREKEREEREGDRAPRSGNASSL